MTQAWEMVRGAPWLGYGSGFTFSLPATAQHVPQPMLDNGLPESRAMSGSSPRPA